VKGIETHLKYQCPATICECGYDGCDVSLPRKDRVAHQNTVCPYEWICCPYSKQFGCSHFVLRKDIAQHSDDASAHLLLIATKLAMLPALMARSVHLERTAVEEKRTTTMGRESTRTNITTNKLTWVNSNPT